MAPRSRPAAGAAGRRRMGGRPARRRGRPRHRTHRVAHHEELRAHPRTGLRIVSLPHHPRPHGRGHAARTPCRSPPGTASRRANGHGARPRATPPPAPSPPDPLLAVQTLRRAPLPGPRRNSAMHSRQGEHMRSRTLLQVVLMASLAAALPARAAFAADGDIGGAVADSATGTPLPGGEVRVMRGGTLIATAVTDAFGRYAVHNLPGGSYRVEVRYLGYRSEAHDVSVGATEAVSRADFRLAPIPINLSAVEVSTTVPLAVDTRTGNQIYKQNDYHGAPTNTTSPILQQSIVGAAPAPTGEVHIRGQHAEYTYYVDGVPVPAGISGSLNELFDPQVVNQIDFQTGGWDAEYGNKNAAVVNVTTRIPSGGFHLDASGYGGSF